MAKIAIIYDNLQGGGIFLQKCVLKVVKVLKDLNDFK